MSRQGPTVVLVHGAFADASGFGGVIRELQDPWPCGDCPRTRSAAWRRMPPR